LEVSLSVINTIRKLTFREEKLIRIDPDGHDTWKFNLFLIMDFSDGTRLSDWVNGLSLSQNNREATQYRQHCSMVAVNNKKLF
jgi:hypothetical protein